MYFFVAQCWITRFVAMIGCCRPIQIGRRGILVCTRWWRPFEIKNERSSARLIAVCNLSDNARLILHQEKTLNTNAQVYTTKLPFRCSGQRWRKFILIKILIKLWVNKVTEPCKALGVLEPTSANVFSDAFLPGNCSERNVDYTTICFTCG